MSQRWLAGIGNQGFGIRPGRGELIRQPASCEDEQPNAGAAAGAAANIKFCLMPAWRFAARNLPRSASVVPSLNSHPPWRGQCDFEYLAYQPNGALFTWRIRCSQSRVWLSCSLHTDHEHEDEDEHEHEDIVDGDVVLFLNGILNFNDHKCKLILNALLRLNLCFGCSFASTSLSLSLSVSLDLVCWQTSKAKIMSFNYLHRVTVAFSTTCPCIPNAGYYQGTTHSIVHLLRQKKRALF